MPPAADSVGVMSTRVTVGVARPSVLISVTKTSPHGSPHKMHETRTDVAWNAFGVTGKSKDVVSPVTQALPSGLSAIPAGSSPPSVRLLEPADLSPPR